MASAVGVAAVQQEVGEWRGSGPITVAVTEELAGSRLQLTLSGQLVGSIAVSVPTQYPSSDAAGCLVFETEDEDLEDAVAALNATVDAGTATLPALLDMLQLGAEEGFDDLIPDISDEDGSFDSSDDELVLDGESGDEGEEDLEEAMKIQRLHLLHRLKKKEEALRLSGGEESLPENAKSIRSIFSAEEAGKLLLRDIGVVLEGRDGGKHSIDVTAVHDDVFVWNVQFGDFPDCPLGTDLDYLIDEHGYRYVEVQLTFLRALYPFYPPALTLVRPRLSPVTTARLMNLRALQLDHWSPFREEGMLSVLKGLHSTLSAHGRIDLDFPLNGLGGGASGGAYSELERLLLSLQRTVDVRTRDAPFASTADEDAGLTSKQLASSATLAAPGDESAARTAGPSGPFAAGTGYSGGSDAGWDDTAYVAARKEKDHQFLLALQGVLAYLDPLTLGGRSPTLMTRESLEAGRSGADGGAATAAGEEAQPASLPPFIASAYSYSERVRSRLGPEGDWGSLAAAAGGVSDTLDARERVLAQAAFHIAGSCLLPLLLSVLSNDSVMDLTRHHHKVCAALHLAASIASRPLLAPLLLLPAGPEGATSLDATLSVSAADMEATNLRSTQAGIVRALVCSGGTGRSVASVLADRARQAKMVIAASEGAAAEAHAAVSDSDFVLELLVEVDVAVKAGIAPQGGLWAQASADFASTQAALADEDVDFTAPAAGAGGSGEWTPDDEASYVAAMRPLQYEQLGSGKLTGYHYAGGAAKVTARSRKDLRRIGKEHADLMSSLPCFGSTSIYLRAPEARMDTLQVLIIAPEGTPYSGGAFLFDVFLPAGFPSGPPSVNLQTTGSGSVRFNPNLYNCGKVCLSILGTWSGSAGEAWNPEVSSLLQVFMSIQSLIFVDEPYFNEPGYQRSIGTAKGTKASQEYNDNIRVATLRFGFRDMLKTPPHGFEQVIRQHFRLRRGVLEAQMGEWEADMRSRSSTHLGPLKKAVQEVKAALAAL